MFGFYLPSEMQDIQLEVIGNSNIADDQSRDKKCLHYKFIAAPELAYHKIHHNIECHKEQTAVASLIPPERLVEIFGLQCRYSRRQPEDQYCRIRKPECLLPVRRFQRCEKLFHMFSLKLLPINHQHHNTQNQKYGQHHQHTHVKTFVFCFQYIEIRLVINQRHRNHGKYQKYTDHSTDNRRTGFRKAVGSVRNCIFLHKISSSI